MIPLGCDLLNVLPFRDPIVCDYVRSLPDVTVREPHHHPDFHIRCLAGTDALHQALADDMFDRIARAAEEGCRFVAVFPVGPTAQYPLLAARLNRARLDCHHVHLFFMDEYAHEDGTPIDRSASWSFERTAHEKLLQPLDEALRPPPGQVHFPGPHNIAQYDELIMEASDGQGAEVVYGGIGWSGHFAFWDPHLWDEFADLDSWRQAHAAFVRLHPLTILHNSIRAGGDWSSILPCAYTMGPGILLSARYRSFWITALFGNGMSWQRFIGRLATHGPVTPLVPASFLQTAPGEVVFMTELAEPIAGPRTQWQ